MLDEFELEVGMVPVPAALGAKAVWAHSSNAFSNATFSGQVDAIEVKFDDSFSAVSFWGYANQNASGTSGQSFFIWDAATFPLFARFIGQVDQFAIGYNAATNDFKYVPVRITQAGMELVTAPNISIGTRFSFQFVLFLAD